MLSPLREPIQPFVNAIIAADEDDVGGIKDRARFVPATTRHRGCRPPQAQPQLLPDAGGTPKLWSRSPVEHSQRTAEITAIRQSASRPGAPRLGTRPANPGKGLVEKPWELHPSG